MKPTEEHTKKKEEIDTIESNVEVYEDFISQYKKLIDECDDKLEKIHESLRNDLGCNCFGLGVKCEHNTPD